MKTLTPTPKAKDLKQNWFIIDASGKTLGEVAVQVATLLTGKHKPTYVPHMDCGDGVVVTNAAHIRVSSRKMIAKKYEHHSGYPGGFKSYTLEQMMAKHPSRVLLLAVKGMLPKNKLGAALLTKLRVYKDDQHQQYAQHPVAL